MGEFEPYDVTKLNEIIIFDRGPEVIELSREGKYINLIKQGEEDKRYFRFNLQTNEFERVNFYKTVDDKVSKVSVKNITYWFTNCKLITKDVHFGRLVIFAKNDWAFNNYSSPVRFVQQLGHRYISNLEKWEAIGCIITDVEEYFGDRLVLNQSWRRDIRDCRKDIYLDKYKTSHGIHIPFSPADCSKDVLDYLKNKHRFSLEELNDAVNNYNAGEFAIHASLAELDKSDEFLDIFSYTAKNYGGEHTYHVFNNADIYNVRHIRNNIIKAVKDYSLDYIAFCRWIKKQKNVEKNDIAYLFETGHYLDYLRCEFELKEGYRSKMVKYPDNFRTEFHKVMMEFEAVHGGFDIFLFKKRVDENRNLEHTGVKFCMTLPEDPDDIKEEAAVLQHCVRTYIKPMTEGKTLIIFLREKKNIADPLVTVEVKDGTIRQAYGKNDSKPSKEQLDFLRLWADKKDLRMACWRGG